MRRWAAAATAAICAMAAAGEARASRAPLLDLRDCLLTLHVFMDDSARLQPAFVPGEYKPLAWVPGEPFIALWSAGCQAISVKGRPARAANLAIAAVAVEHPDRPAGEQGPAEMPNLWAHYVHRIYSDDATVVRALRRQGFPAERSAAITMKRTEVAWGLPAPLRPLAETRVAVAGAWSSWTRPLIQHEPAHSHLNTFYRDGSEGTSVLELRIPLAQDHFCELAVGELCGTVEAKAGTAAADLLGAAHRSADAAVDHDPVRRGVAMAYTVDKLR